MATLSTCNISVLKVPLQGNYNIFSQVQVLGCLASVFSQNIVKIYFVDGILHENW